MGHNHSLTVPMFWTDNQNVKLWNRHELALNIYLCGESNRMCRYWSPEHIEIENIYTLDFPDSWTVVPIHWKLEHYMRLVIVERTFDYAWKKKKIIQLIKFVRIVCGSNCDWPKVQLQSENSGKLKKNINNSNGSCQLFIYCHSTWLHTAFKMIRVVFFLWSCFLSN